MTSIKLEVRKIEYPDIWTGQKKGKIYECEVVRLFVSSLNGYQKMELSVYVVPSCTCLCAPLQKNCIQLSPDELQQFRGMKFADNTANEDSQVIHKLIGMDFYWKFMKGQLKHMQSGPVAVETELG